MPNITNLLNIIKTAIYGKDMRLAIHDAIATVNNGVDAIENNAGMPNGYATLDDTGKVPQEQIPDIALDSTFEVKNQEEMLALHAQVGDIAVRTDLNRSFILKVSDPSILSHWQELLTPVTSVAGKTGDVKLSKEDVGLSQVDNTADMDKPVSTAVQEALDGLEETVQTVQNGLSEHIEDETVHITQQEREAWNDKTPKSHASETDEYGAGTGELYGHVRLANRLDVEESGQYALDAAQAKEILDQIGDGASSIDVAETVTGEPGTEALVENVGTEKDVLLKFTIPQGLQGPQGEPGYLSPEGPLADIQIGPRTIPNPYTGDGTVEGLLTELLSLLADAAQPWRAQVFISDTEPDEGPCLWFNTAWKKREDLLQLGPVTGDTPVIAVIEGKQYGVENASVDGTPAGRTYDFEILN